MSDVQQVLDVYREATAANAATRGRLGSVVHIAAPSEDVIVGADLHGHRLNMRRILDIADSARHPHRHLVLQEVCHGGPVYPGTRACMSHLMLEDVARLKANRPDQVHFLLSNHELAELIELAIVKRNRMLNLQFRFGMEVQYGDEADRVRAAACMFIRSCPLALRTENRAWISHSAPPNVAEEGYDTSIFRRQLRDEDLVRGGAAFQLVWGRDFRQENADAFAKLVDADILIHGHEPCHTGFMTPNSRQLILDSSKTPACCLRLPLDIEPTLENALAGVAFL